MFVDFDKMAKDARVWIYQADRQLSTEESKKITASMTDFLENWSAHGQGLFSSAKVFYDRFLVVSVDEKKAAASGCSIDASVHFIKELEQKLNVNFFDRSKVAFLYKGEVFVESIGELKNKIQKGDIQKKSITFNNLVKNKEEFDHNWKVEAENSWLNRYFQ